MHSDNVNSPLPIYAVFVFCFLNFLSSSCHTRTGLAVPVATFVWCMCVFVFLSHCSRWLHHRRLKHAILMILEKEGLPPWELKGSRLWFDYFISFFVSDFLLKLTLWSLAVPPFALMMTHALGLGHPVPQVRFWRQVTGLIIWGY